MSLEPLTPDLIKQALERALHDEHRGLGTYSVSIDDQAMEHFAHGCGGDVRSALNALEPCRVVNEGVSRR